MDRVNTSRAGGPWTCARPVAYSQRTQEMLKLLMQESHLLNGRKRQIRECLKNGAPLHLACVSKPPPPSRPQSKPSESTPSVPPKAKRTMEQCKAGGSYIREKFRPGPTRDLEKEKQRFQRLMAFGTDQLPVIVPQKEAPEEKDRFDELVEEIEERRQFLDDMAALGQEHQYVSFINAEMSQRIREMQLLDKTRNETKEGKLDGAEDEQ